MSTLRNLINLLTCSLVVLLAFLLFGGQATAPSRPNVPLEPAYSLAPSDEFKPITGATSRPNAPPVSALEAFLSACGVDRLLAAQAAIEHRDASAASRTLDFIAATAHECGVTTQIIDVDQAKLQAGEFHPGRFFIGILAPNARYVSFRAPHADDRHVLLMRDGERPQWVPRTSFHVDFQSALRPEGNPEPLLWLPETEIDVGQIHGLAPVPWEVHILNPGGRPLHIVEAVTTCGCLALDRYPHEIPPFGEAVLHCRVLPAKSALKDHFEQAIDITTADGRKTRIPVSGLLARRILVTPAIHDLGDLHPAEPLHRYHVRIHSRDPQRTIVEPIEADDGLLIGDAQVADDGTLQLSVTVDVADIGDDAYRGFKRAAMLRVRFPGEDGGLQEDTTVIMAEGRRLPWIEVYPGAVFAAGVSPGDEITRTIHFTARAQGPKRVAVEDDRHINAVVRENNNALIVTARLPEGQSELRSQLQFRCGNRRVTIPVTLLP